MERSQPQHHEIRDCLENPTPGAWELKRWPALGYVFPFVLFVSLLAIGRYVAVPQPLRFCLVLASLIAFSRGLVPARPSHFLSSVFLGIAVFFIWIGPDVLFHGYRSSILFTNAIVGYPRGTTVTADKISPIFLIFRVLGSVLVVPIIEELFWRGWMMRWIANKDFRRVPIGMFQPEAFWIVALLFASEHGSYWDVGLVTGVVFNWWIIRTRNLMDCVIAHAVTNGCLAIYVIYWNQWQYWL